MKFNVIAKTLPDSKYCRQCYSTTNKAIVFLAVFLTNLLYSMHLSAQEQNNYQKVRELRSKGSYDSAIGLQLSFIDQNQHQGKRPKSELPTHYHNIGILYHESGDYLKARNALEESIAIATKYGGAYQPSVIDSLTTLGLVHVKSGAYKRAMEKFQEAQHIVHRIYGVKSIKQENILDWMSTLYLKQNQFKAANTLQHLNYETYRASYGATDPQTVPAILKLATWLQTTAQYLESIIAFEQAIAIIEKNNLPATMLQQSLSGLAHSYYLKGKCCADQYMTQAASAIGENDSTDNIEKGHAYIEAADMSLLMNDSKQSQSLYETAWQYGSPLSRSDFEKPSALGISRIDRMVDAYQAVTKNTNITSETIKFPQEHKVKPKVKLVGAPLPLCASKIKDLAKNRDYSKYVVDLDFEVRTDGQATDIKVVNSNAPRAITQLLSRIVRLYRFRPSLSDGKPVQNKMSLRQTFTEDGAASTQFAMGKVAAFHGCHLLAAL